MFYIGIDPGKSGGIAVLNDDGNVVEVVKMPDNESELLEFLQCYESSKPSGLIDALPPNRAVLEFVRSSPQMGVRSAFTFGQGYGSLRMALCAAKISYEEVTPQKWQGAMGCRTRGDKNVTKRTAQQLFPRVAVTHSIADALLMAEYCRLKWLRK